MLVGSERAAAELTFLNGFVMPVIAPATIKVRTRTSKMRGLVKAALRTLLVVRFLAWLEKRNGFHESKDSFCDIFRSGNSTKELNAEEKI